MPKSKSKKPKPSTLGSGMAMFAGQAFTQRKNKLKAAERKSLGSKK